MSKAAMEAAGPDTVCLHCGHRRAEHIRRHHGNGPKGTLWYCRTPTERPFTRRPASLADAVRAALDGPLAWMLGPESDWKDGEVGVGHGFRGQANEAHALLFAGLAAFDAAKGGRVRWLTEDEVRNHLERVMPVEVTNLHSEGKAYAVEDIAHGLGIAVRLPPDAAKGGEGSR